MHELAHIRLNHLPASVQLSATGMLLLSDYSDEQEDEADWLMGALLLPRCVLLDALRRDESPTIIASRHQVSQDLVRWRIRMTGVGAQIGSSRRKIV